MKIFGITLCFHKWATVSCKIVQKLPYDEHLWERKIRCKKCLSERVEFLSTYPHF